MTAVTVPKPLFVGCARFIEPERLGCISPAAIAFHRGVRWGASDGAGLQEPKEQDVIQTPEVAFLVLLAGAISLSSRPLRRQLVFPVGALALAIAGFGGVPDLLRPRPSPPCPPGSERSRLGSFSSASPGPSWPRSGPVGRGSGSRQALMAAIWAARPLLVAAPLVPSLLAAVVIVMIVMLALVIGRLSRIRSWVVEADRRWLGSPGRATNPASVGIVCWSPARCARCSRPICRSSSPARWCLLVGVE